MILAKTNTIAPGGRRFEFARDSFAFPNELLWEYRVDGATGKMTFSKRDPKPDYALRCFVLTRVTRQFLYHVRFAPEQKTVDEQVYRQLIREVIRRSPLKPCPVDGQIVIPGYAGLREFSQAHEKLLKAGCGGAWRSYFLRSHWRMIFPISRAHQAHTAASLAGALRQNHSPIIHLVKFPSLTINHGMILFAVAETGSGLEFQAYDPNHPAAPVIMTFDRTAQTFYLPANSYWAGGDLNIIEIYRGWFL